MMGPTHVALGLFVLVLPVATAAPELATAATIGVTVGALVPDIDLLVGRHRRTLHYPVLYWLVALFAVAPAVLVRSPAWVAAALALLAAALHSASDALGAGDELRPWERTDPRAVYDHLRQRWVRARYVVPYDGSPADLAVTVVAAVPVAVLLPGPPRWVAAAAVAVAVPYALVRKRSVKYFARIT